MMTTLSCRLKIGVFIFTLVHGFTQKPIEFRVLKMDWAMWYTVIRSFLKSIFYKLVFVYLKRMIDVNQRLLLNIHLV